MSSDGSLVSFCPARKLSSEEGILSSKTPECSHFGAWGGARNGVVSQALGSIAARPKEIISTGSMAKTRVVA